MYKVQTDKEFFEEFAVIASKVASLSYPFQNPDTEMTNEEYGEWQRVRIETEREVTSFLSRANARLKFVIK